MREAFLQLPRMEVGAVRITKTECKVLGDWVIDRQGIDVGSLEV